MLVSHLSLNSTETQLLSVLYIIGPVTDGELGYAVMKQSKEFNRINLADMLQRLENKGLVKTENTISLTEKGKNTLETHLNK